MTRVILAGLLFVSGMTGAENALVSQGFSHFYNLEYDQALSDFRAALVKEPNNPDIHNYVAEALVFREMYRNGALESELVTGSNSFLRRPKLNPPPEVKKEFLSEIDQSMQLSQERLKENPRDTEALYALGIAYGLRANYSFLIEKAWLNALRDATAGRKLHNQITEIDPSNVDARLMQGLHDYVVGSLPFFYKMLGFIAGFRGDKEEGIRVIQEVAAHGQRNKVDAEIFLCALYRRERQPAKALPLLADLLMRYPRNYLLRFEEAQMYSDLGKKKQAIASIEKVIQLKEGDAPGYVRVPWEKIYFQLGTIEFWYNDLDQALEHMKKVTSSPHELNLNMGVMAWMRIGQIYDLTQRRSLAIQAYKKAIAFAPQADAARESRRYLSAPYRREKG